MDAAAIFFIVLFIIAAYGWFKNIVKLLTPSLGESTTKRVLRGFGIFFVGLGAILGYF